jgi:tRNA threonylcarbamoyladenosine biosynthesis protein TsaE
MYKYEFFSNSPTATLSLGKRIGERLPKGSVIALTGELGCGKTLLTRGICDGLGVPLRQVNSPSFVLVNEYQGRILVFHLDMYQINSASEAVDLGMMDYLARARSGVMIIEWAERITSLLPYDILKINFKILSDRKRKIVITARGSNSICIIKEIKQT